MEKFEDFKKELTQFYKEKFGGDLIITSTEPTGESEAVETELNGSKFYTFSLSVMYQNWQNINLVLETSFVEYVATTLYKNTSK